MHVNFVCPICEYNTLTEEAEERLRPAPARTDMIVLLERAGLAVTDANCAAVTSAYCAGFNAGKCLQPAVAAWKSPVAAKIAHAAIKQGRVRVLLEDEQDAAAGRELEQHERVRVDRIDDSTIEVWWT